MITRHRGWGQCNGKKRIRPDGRCHSTMAQTTMPHASMTIPLWRRSSLAHPGMARSSTAQVQYGAFHYGAVPGWRFEASS